jgi:hypothetical protein
MGEVVEVTLIEPFSTEISTTMMEPAALMAFELAGGCALKNCGSSKRLAKILFEASSYFLGNNFQSTALR